MKSTFTTISGMKFESNDSYTYFYATFTNPVTEQITKKRISKHDFEQAKKEDEIIRANLERKAIEAEAEKAIEEQDAQQELEDELLKAAENPEITVEQFAKMVEEADKPKAKKSSKKAAYQSRVIVADDKVADVTLTEKQVDFIKHLPDTHFWESGIHSTVWTDVLCDEIGGQFTNKPMTVGAMVSTLCEKGLGFRTTQRHDGRKCVAFSLTDLGKAVAKELGLN